MAARAPGSLAAAQRVSTSSSVRTAGSNTMERIHRRSNSRVGSSTNSTRRMIPSGGRGLKNDTPTPPSVTSRLTRSGFVAASRATIPPPSELPTIATRSMPSPSRKASTAVGAARTGFSFVAWLVPNPGRSSTRVWKCRAKSGRLSPKFAQPLTPGPEPCTSSSGGPSPASW